jgi:hypothetical protein
VWPLGHAHSSSHRNWWELVPCHAHMPSPCIVKMILLADPKGLHKTAFVGAGAECRGALVPQVRSTTYALVVQAPVIPPQEV